jgi:hypothetical protein
MTAGPPPAGPGTTRTSDTVGPGGSISTGSDPSGSNPVVVKVISEKGGKLWIDEIANPDRPGEPVSCDDDPGNPECEETNPEDDRSKKKNWYGPAIRVTPSQGSGRTTIIFTIDGDTDLVDPSERARSLEENPAGISPSCSGSVRKLKLKYLPNGDTQITQQLVVCGRNMPVFHFYNPPWQVRLGEFFGSFTEDLRGVLASGYIPFGLYCMLECKRTLSASIAPKSAKKLGLRSGDLGTVRTKFGEEWDRKFRLSRKVRRAFRRIARSGGQINIKWRAKAVGPAGQVFKRGFSSRLKAEDQSDSF